MGKKTHGPVLVAAIEHNDFEKVREVLLTHIKSKAKIQELCTSEVRRLASEYTEVPILLAASLPDPNIIKFLVAKQDVNVNFVHREVVKRKTKVKSPLINAVRGSLIATVETILALNANPNVQDHKGRTALHHAVRKADYRMAKMLLSRGAQPNLTDIAGNTPLHIATIFGHLELVKLLVRHDADLFKKGTGGAIPIHMAAKEGHSILVKLFCQYDVNVNMKVPCYDNREKAPIHVAAEEGHAETVLMLLDQCGADPNIRDSLGESPLHCSCLREYDPMGMKSKDDYTETTKILLQYGAHIDLQNSRGETPLHLAARNEFQKTVDVLIHAGSDPLLEDSAGYKPFDLATADDTVTIQILKSAMEERDRIMNDAMEIQAKGYSTSLAKQSVSSRSGLNVNNIGSNEFIIGPNRTHSSNAIYEDGYLQPIGLRPRTRGDSQESSQDILDKSRSTSSSGSKPAFSRNQKKSQSLLPTFRNKSGSKGSLHNLDESNDTSGVARRGMNLQVQNRGRLPSPPTVQGPGMRESRATDATGLWDVTPRTSVSTFKDHPQNKTIQAIHKSYESLPDEDAPRQPSEPTINKRGRRAPKQSKSKKKAIQIMAAHPNANKIPGIQQIHETSDDDSFFDDESFDTLDTLSEKAVPILPPKPASNNIAHTPEEQRKIMKAASNHSLHSWLDEQANILKKDGTMPDPPSEISHEISGTYVTGSDISSVSKVNKTRGQQKPPPLPPKPLPKARLVQQPQQDQPTSQTVIKVVQGRNSPISETTTTAYTEETESYGRHHYGDSRMTPDTVDSSSVQTDSTVQNAKNKRKKKKVPTATLR